MKYLFPAILTPENNGLYSVEFPDIEGCYSQGNSLADAVHMASDALALMLTDMEDRKDPIPTSTSPDEIAHTPEQIVTLVYADTVDYRRKYNNRSMNITLTLPTWLNTMAKQANINFSQTLQEALKAKLRIDA
jgi:predicted RNase H-like HicB family nuclease